MPKVELIRLCAEDAAQYLLMQQAAFQPLLTKYRDYGTSPAQEDLASVQARLTNPLADSYFIRWDGQIVGALSILRKREERHRLSRIFILPQMQGKGIGRAAMEAMEALYPEADSWELDTIAQEVANCRLYRKMGYRWTGHMTYVNPRMTLIDFVKHIHQ